MSSEVNNRVSGQRIDDPVFTFITPVSASGFESALPKVKNGKDVKSLTDGLDTLPDFRGIKLDHLNGNAPSPTPAHGTDTNSQSQPGTSAPNIIRPLSSDLFKELEEAQSKLNGHLDIQKIRIGGQERQVEDYLKERTFNYKLVSNVSHVANSVVTRPLNFLDKTFGWDLYTKPPVSLMAQNQKAVEECEAEIAYRASVVKKLEPLIKETGQRLEELKLLNSQLGEVSDARQSLILRKAIQEKVAQVTSLLNEASKADSKELKGDWEKKMKGLSSSLKEYVTQLDTSEIVLQSTQKGLIITAGVLVSGGAVAGVVAPAGFFASGAVGTLAGMGTSGAFIGAETISRGVLYGENVLSVDYAKQKGTQFLVDTKDAALYVYGNKAATGIISIGGKFFTNLVSRIPFLNHAGKAAVSAGGATAEGQVISQGLYANSKILVARGASNLFGGAAEGSLTELAPAMIDTEYQVRTGKLDRSLWWNEVYHRVGLAAVGAGVGRSIDKSVTGLSGTFNGITNRCFGKWSGTALVQNVVKWGPLKLAGFTAEGISDLNSGTAAAYIKEGYFYYGEKKLSTEERRQIVTTMIASRFTSAASAHVRNKVELAHQAKVSAIAEAESAKVSQLHSNLGIKDSKAQLLVASANDSSIQVKESGSLKNNAHTAHLGVDPEIGRRQVAHSLTQQASLSADKVLGGVVSKKITEPLKAKLESVLPASESAPSLHHDRKSLIDRLHKGASGVVASISSHLGTNVPGSEAYAGNLSKLVKEYNNARKVTDTEGLTKSQRKHIEAEARKNPFGADKEIKVADVEKPTSLVEVGGVAVKATGNFLLGFAQDIPILGLMFKSDSWVRSSRPVMWMEKKVGQGTKWVSDATTNTYEAAKKVQGLKQVIALSEGTVSATHWVGDKMVMPVARWVGKDIISPVAHLAVAGGVVSIFTPVASANPAIGIFLLYSFGQAKVIKGGLDVVGTFSRGVTSRRVNPRTQGEDAGRVMARFAEGSFLLKEVDAQRKLNGKSIITNEQESILRAEIDDAKSSLAELNPRSKWFRKVEKNNLSRLNGEDGPKVDRILTEAEQRLLLTELNNSFSQASKTDIRENALMVQVACNNAHRYRVSLSDYASLLGNAFSKRILPAERTIIHSKMLAEINGEIVVLHQKNPNKHTKENIELAERKKALLEKIDPVVGAKWEDIVANLKKIDPEVDVPRKISNLNDTARKERLDHLGDRSRHIIWKFENTPSERHALQKEFLALVEEYRILSSNSQFRKFAEQQIKDIDLKKGGSGSSTSGSTLSLPKVELLKTHLEKVMGLRQGLRNDLSAGLEVEQILKKRRDDGHSDNLIKKELQRILSDEEVELAIKRQEVEHYLSFGLGSFIPDFLPLITKARFSDDSSARKRIEQFVEAVFPSASTFKDEAAYKERFKKAPNEFIESGGLKFQELYTLMAKASKSKTKSQREIEDRGEAQAKMRNAFRQLLGDSDPTGTKLNSIDQAIIGGVKKDVVRFSPLESYVKSMEANTLEVNRVVEGAGLSIRQTRELCNSASNGDIATTRQLLEKFSPKISGLNSDRIIRLTEDISTAKALLREFVVTLRFGDATTNWELQNQARRVGNMDPSPVKFLFGSLDIGYPWRYTMKKLGFVNSGWPDSIKEVNRIVADDPKVFKEMGDLYDFLMSVRYGDRPDISVSVPKEKNLKKISSAQAGAVIDKLLQILVEDTQMASRARNILNSVEDVTMPPSILETERTPVVH